MRTVVFITAALAALLTAVPLPAQVYEDIFEELEGLEQADVTDLLRSLQPEPIRLATLRLQQVQEIWFLTAEQKSALAARMAQKPIDSYAELARILQWPEPRVRLLFALQESGGSSFSFLSRSRFRTDGSRQQFLVHGRFAPWSVYLRTEKDPGEVRLDDFRTAWVQFADPRRRYQLLAGDFYLRAGCGLVFSAPYAQFSLNTPQSLVRHTAARLEPFRTTLENFAFRGLAGAVQLGGWRLLSFASSAHVDAVLDSSGRVRSLPQSGLHRTRSERSARDRLKVQSWGVVVQWNPRPTLELQLSHFRQGYGRPLDLRDERRPFAFRGRHNDVSGISWLWMPVQGLSLFSEGAASSGGRAAIAGLRFKQRGLHFLLLNWRVEPDYYNAYGAVPGTAPGEAQNEIGRYLGAVWRSSVGRWSGYLLHRRTLARSYRFSLPTSRVDAALYWEKRIAPIARLRVRLRYRSLPQLHFFAQQQFQPSGRHLIMAKQVALRPEIRLQLHPRFIYRLQTELLRRSSPAGRPQTGFFQSHGFLLHKGALRLIWQWTDFATEDWDARVYLFESLFPDYVLPAALYGEGERAFFALRISAAAGLEISLYGLRQAQAEKNHRQEWGLQVRWIR